jgi:hypothetical protein
VTPPTRRPAPPRSTHPLCRQVWPSVAAHATTYRRARASSNLPSSSNSGCADCTQLKNYSNRDGYRSFVRRHEVKVSPLRSPVQRCSPGCLTGLARTGFILM